MRHPLTGTGGFWGTVDPVDVPPALLLVGHGSRDPRHAVALGGLGARVAAAAPGVTVSVSFLEHSQPAFEAAADSLVGLGVVVPLLLGAAYHATADLPVRAEAHRAALTVTPPLGPDPLLDAVVLSRAAGLVTQEEVDGLVVVGTGSSWARADAEVVRLAGSLHRTLAVPVAAAFASRPGSVPAAVTALTDSGARRIGLVPWVLAEGVLLDRARRSAGRPVVAQAPPLAAGPDLVPLVLRRYRTALATGSPLAVG